MSSVGQQLPWGPERTPLRSRSGLVGDHWGLSVLLSGLEPPRDPRGRPSPVSVAFGTGAAFRGWSGGPS
eukprot:5209997-Alexandrium_andersonii.AAC.1